MSPEPQTCVFTDIDDETLASAHKTEVYTWIDLISPTSDTVQRMGHDLGWHPLLIEDVMSLGQRPKVEPYEGLAFAVVYGATPPHGGEPAHLVEVAVVVHGDYVVTVRNHNVARLDDLRTTIDGLGSTGLREASVVYRIVDHLVDSTMQASTAISERIETLEARIESSPSHELLPALRRLRRVVSSYRSTLGAQRDALTSLPQALLDLDELDSAENVHFRDVSDHAYRVADELDLARELVDGSFESYFAALAAQQGKVSQRLTVIATIFLPLTFVTGFFGQNFGWMIDHINTRADFIGMGIGGSAISVVLLSAFIIKLRWW
jgi:magnesium transporter